MLSTIANLRKISVILVKYSLLIILCFLTNRGFLSAATTPAQEMEMLLGAKTITYAQAARFVLEASDVLITGYPEVAFDLAVQRNWLPKELNASDTARLDRISLLLMRSFDIKGGLFYSLIGNSGYAYRELVYKGVIQLRSDPHMAVSGERLIFYINRIFSLYEGSQGILTKRGSLDSVEKTIKARWEELAATIAGIFKEQQIKDTTVEVAQEGVRITLSNINFLPDSWELPNAEKRKLNEIASVLSKIPNVRLFIAGHTTRIGTPEYLIRLSTNRAQEVANYLISLGACKKGNTVIVGYGASRLLIEGSTPEALAANRRVEIIILEN